jgi:hypothetical protein
MPFILESCRRWAGHRFRRARLVGANLSFRRDREAKFMKFIDRGIATLFSVLVLLASTAAAETIVGSGLQLPSKVILTPRGELLIAENGSGPNLGRISLVDRITGSKKTVLVGLPAGINSAEGTPAPSGPSGLFLSGNTLYILIAEGDGVLAGPIAGTQIPNPSPASPILSSLLALTFTGALEDLPADLTLSLADHTALRGGATINLANGKASLRLIKDFDNYSVEPRADFPLNVRHSDPYGVVVSGNGAYIADAGQNSIRKVDLTTGVVSTVASFGTVPNPTPVGGPVVEAVPDSIRLDGNRLLVTLLSGFPFATGLSRVVAVDPATGVVTPVIDGLTTAIDAVPLTGGATKQYIVSEFSSNLLASAPGRILLVNGTQKTALGDNLASPSSLAVDQRTGEIFATQIFPGTITRINAAGVLPAGVAGSIIPVAASIPGSFGSRFETSLQLSNPNPYQISGIVNFRGGAAVTGLPYLLLPNETKSYANVMTAAGITGATSLDLDPGVGPPPVAIARIFDTSRSSASTGTVIAQVSPDEALRTGDRGLIVAAADPAISRTNIGVRALGDGATVHLTLYRSDGTQVGTTDLAIGPNGLAQSSEVGLFGTSPGADDSIVVQVTAGSAIVYGSIVNNTTQETSYQRAARNQD